MNEQTAKTLEMYLLAGDSLDGVMGDENEWVASRFIVRGTSSLQTAVTICVASWKHTERQALDPSITSQTALVFTMSLGQLDMFI